MVVEIQLNYSSSLKKELLMSEGSVEQMYGNLSAPSKFLNCNQMVIKIHQPFRSGLIYLTVW